MRTNIEERSTRYLEKEKIMKKLLFLAALGCFGIFGLSACGGSSTGNENSASASKPDAVNKPVQNTNSVMSTAVNPISTPPNAIASIPSSNPNGFLAEAGPAELALAELGTAAGKNADNAEIKKMGPSTAADYTKMNGELKALAAKKNVTIPAGTGDYKATVDRISKAEGGGFDKLYVDIVLSTSENQLTAFKAQADGSSDPDVKAFAAKNMPIIQKHLDAMKAVRDKIMKK